MKSFMKMIVFIIALCMAVPVSGYAQEPSQVEKAVTAIVNKYEDVKGVESMTVVKGHGLELVKAMFNKQFGKEFMKGVTSITVINYSDASQETCQLLHKDFDVFLSLLEEFRVGDEKSFADNEYIRSFASVSEGGTLSDFIIAVEKEDSKMFMYMAGDIKVE